MRGRDYHPHFRRYFPLRRLVLTIVAGIVVATALPALVGIYRFEYVRPEEIQKDLVGHPLAYSNSLIRFEHNMTGYGDARFRWIYTLPDSPELRRLCQSYDREICVIRQDLGRDGRYIALYFSNGQLTVEESWS